MNNLFDRGQPTFINPEGVKWWLDKTGTNYAQNPNINEQSLPDISVWYVEFVDGDKQYVILNKQEPIYESKQYENIGVKIDILKLANDFKKED